ncbi:nucleosome-remodeling factor subunit BPTF-like [Rhinopithecus roxellana]|uniref:nucleosome-remodeling factor subunit BPTF-like n=1 Tax=Rhinopithecus roxellana TaxID=61622 RepID=UPI00123773BA|nr:nucleosome-remodeling factor subunit BPTF-like [Rhinopithecus roxellana]
MEEEDCHTEETHESEDNEEDEMEEDDDDSDYSEEQEDDDEDASYYMESSFRSHRTYSSTPASPLRLEFGGAIPTQGNLHLPGQMILLLQPPE